MINGAHVLFYTDDPESDRAFFRDVLGFPSVDVGGGWLIFKLPPAEAAFHPSEGHGSQAHGEGQLLGAVLYLMCDDLQKTLKMLAAKNVEHSPIEEARWGIKTTISLPGGGEVGLYQPKHPTAYDLNSKDS
jgi:catechol 2,3-dioxygenase-like lactoylglutathione lyase family enzyme